MITRQSVWSQPEIVELLDAFVPAADEVHRLQRGQDAECKLFRLICEKGHYGGRTEPSDTRQGIYALSAEGTFLASCNTRDPRRVATMLSQALKAFQSLPDAERQPSEEAGLQVRRWEDLYPKDGLVLHVFSRDLPRENQASDWRGRAWNQDYAWFNEKEFRGWAPPRGEVGEGYSVPRRLLERLARCNLLDNVRGQTPPFARQDIQRLELEGKVTAVVGQRVTIEFLGRSTTAEAGRWKTDNQAPTPPKAHARGFDAQLRGRAEYDRDSQRFISFELVAKGLRRGGTQYNARDDDLEGAPLGIALVLAPDGPKYRVAPSNIWDYGWRKPE